MEATKPANGIVAFLRTGRPEADYTTGVGYRFANLIKRTFCVDGFNVSIQAGSSLYCKPRIDEGPWTHVELGYPSGRPKPWKKWSKYAEEPDRPEGTVYAYVPVEMVEALIALHGGEVPS